MRFSFINPLENKMLAQTSTFSNKIKKILNRFNPRLRYFIVLSILIFIVLSFTLIYQLYISYTDLIPDFGGEYREAVLGLPRFINPVLSPTNDVDRDLVALTYSSLMRYNVNGELVTDLAETYEISEDGKEYKFLLKENIQWEDEAPITSEDILFTIQLIQNPQYASPLFQSWQGVEVINDGDRTILFILSSPYPPFIENTTLGILPKHIWENVTPKNFALTELNLQPIGSGPFKIEKFAKDDAGFISSFTLLRNDNYHGKKPYIDKITLKFYNNENNAITAFNSKNVDGIAFISPINIKLLKNAKSFNLHEFKMPRYFAIFINEERNKLLEKKVIRQALAYATNRNELIDNVMMGYAQKVDTPIPPNITKYYNKNIDSIEYDLEIAKSLLEEAGWVDKNGDGIREKINEDTEEIIKLEFTLTTVKRKELEEVANILKNQWLDAGILLTIDSRELGELQQDFIRKRSYELLMFGEILGAIPDPFSFWHSSQKDDPGLNLSNYKNSTVDRLLEEARQEINEDIRIEKYKQFQEEVVNDLPAIFLYDPFYLYPIQKRVRGIQNAFITDTSSRFVDIENWFIETKRRF